MVYLACPYANAAAEVRNSRVNYASAVAHLLMKASVCVFSPISHGHYINSFAPGAIEHQHWMDTDMKVLPICDFCVVVTLPGWQESKGVSDEIAYSNEIGLPVWIAPVSSPLVTANWILSQLKSSYVKPQTH